MSNLLRESGSGHPGSRIESTCVTPTAQWPSSSSIPQIVNWNGISCNSATVRILRFSAAEGSEYRTVVANLCTILHADRTTMPGSLMPSRNTPLATLSTIGPGGSPAVGVGDFGQRPAGQRPELVDRPAHRHQRPSEDILRNSEKRLDLVLASDVVGSDHRAEPKTAAGENDVLHRRIDAGAADALGIGGLFLPAR